MLILCFNCGSSSVKYRLYDWDKDITLATGIVERIMIGDSTLTLEVPGHDKYKVACECQNHEDAINLIMKTLTSPEHRIINDFSQITAVGHRVVHGGEKFTKSVIITPEVLDTFRELSSLAPLHNPPNILGIEAAQKALPDIPHIAIMDTAWHQTIPDHAYMYALPYEWYENHQVRRYGFHGTSFLYVAKRAAVLLGKAPLDCNLIIAHIGNGVSMNAVKNGVSYDTSMGFTPLEGLIMGTRAGDHDAAIDFYIMRKENYSLEQMDNILNKRSGIKGITGGLTDRRDVIEAAQRGDERSRLALNMESYRICKYIGAYYAALGGADAVIFTAGVGEMCDVIREKALSTLGCMGIKLDPEKNRLARTRHAECDISAPDSRVKVLVIPTDEERVFIEDVVALVEGNYDIHTRFTYRFQSPDYRNSLRDQEFEKECAKNPELRKIVAHPKHR